MKLFRQPFGSALVLAALVLRPCPAIGQHGGGGHGGGGGGHGGGGGGHFGGGGGHFAGFGGSHSHSSAHQSPSHAGGKPVVESTPLVTAKPSAGPTPQTGEFAPFSPGPKHTTIGFPASEQPTTFPALPLHSAQSAGPLSFSGEGHQIWQNFATPSVPAFHTPRATPPAMHPQPPHIIRPPGFFAPPATLVPTFGFWGFNPFWGFGWGCGPLYVWAFGCGGFGYGGYGPGYGYGFGGYYSPTWDYSQAPSSDDTSNEPSPSTWQNPPTGEDLEGNAAVSIPNTVIYLQDGTSYEVTDYWFSDNKLHYVTNYGGENSVALSQIDWQRTVDANAARGVDFTLHPAPPPALTPPPSADSAPPATPQP